MAFELPALPYTANALGARGMCQETLEYHHGKHHQAYVTALNTLLESKPEFHGKSLDEIIKASHNKPDLVGLFNNAGQHWNHSFFWNSLSAHGGVIPETLSAKIVQDFGSVDAFKEEFRKAATTQFGSGWAWLVLGKDGKLAITKTANASNPLAEGHGKALLTVDVWEHAYYIDFRNRRPDYITNFLDKLANYEFAAARLKDA
ncbi:MAG: superoxide dismutase [Acetobacter sp.]|nr:superoxide dismutase [Acetobacter sp.]MBO6085674.1 superoxide dismutase [Acetobacter sp.]MBO6091728.1 superoxide dismutase [Acetobacter sp.]MBO7351239.1 superoxide dismutase [Acetobacter sp.]MBQ3817758.1 superoxide dismutase [Acetobacter sp.]